VTHQLAEVVRVWFQTAGAAGLILPDGWFGRPFDNLHRLTYLEARRYRLVLELDDQVLLIFDRPEVARVESSELVIEGFSQCVFDWLEYGSLRPQVKAFRSGSVRLVPP